MFLDPRRNYDPFKNIFGQKGHPVHLKKNFVFPNKSPNYWRDIMITDLTTWFCMFVIKRQCKNHAVVCVFARKYSITAQISTAFSIKISSREN